MQKLREIPEINFNTKELIEEITAPQNKHPKLNQLSITMALYIKNNRDSILVFMTVEAIASFFDILVNTINNTEDRIKQATLLEFYENYLTFYIYTLNLQHKSMLRHEKRDASTLKFYFEKIDHAVTILKEYLNFFKNKHPNLEKSPLTGEILLSFYANINFFLTLQSDGARKNESYTDTKSTDLPLFGEVPELSVTFLNPHCTLETVNNIKFQFGFYILYNHKDTTLESVTVLDSNIKYFAQKNKKQNKIDQLYYELLSYLRDFRTQKNPCPTSNIRFSDYLERSKKLLTLIKDLMKQKDYINDTSLDFFFNPSPKGLIFYTLHVMQFTRHYIHPELIGCLKLMKETSVISSPEFISWDRHLTIYHEMNEIFEEARMLFLKVPVPNVKSYHNTSYWYYQLSDKLFNESFLDSFYIKSYISAQSQKSIASAKALEKEEDDEKSKMTDENNTPCQELFMPNLLHGMNIIVHGSDKDRKEFIKKLGTKLFVSDFPGILDEIESNSDSHPILNKFLCAINESQEDKEFVLELMDRIFLNLFETLLIVITRTSNQNKRTKLLTFYENIVEFYIVGLDYTLEDILSSETFQKDKIEDYHEKTLRAEIWIKVYLNFCNKNIAKPTKELKSLFAKSLNVLNHKNFLRILYSDLNKEKKSCQKQIILVTEKIKQASEEIEKLETLLEEKKYTKNEPDYFEFIPIIEQPKSVNTSGSLHLEATNNSNNTTQTLLFIPKSSDMLTEPHVTDIENLDELQTPEIKILRKHFYPLFDTTQKLHNDFQYAFYLLHENTEDVKLIEEIEGILKTFKANKHYELTLFFYPIIVCLKKFGKKQPAITTITPKESERFKNYVDTCEILLVFIRQVVKHQKNDSPQLFATLNLKGLAFYALHTMHLTLDVMHEELVNCLSILEKDKKFEDVDIHSDTFKYCYEYLDYYQQLMLKFNEAHKLFIQIRVSKEKKSYHSSLFWYFQTSVAFFIKPFEQTPYLSQYKKIQAKKTDENYQSFIKTANHNEDKKYNTQVLTELFLKQQQTNKPKVATTVVEDLSPLVTEILSNTTHTHEKLEDLSLTLQYFTEFKYSVGVYDSAIRIFNALHTPLINMIKTTKNNQKKTHLITFYDIFFKFITRSLQLHQKGVLQSPYASENDIRLYSHLIKVTSIITESYLNVIKNSSLPKNTITSNLLFFYGNVNFFHTINTDGKRKNLSFIDSNNLPTQLIPTDIPEKIEADLPLFGQAPELIPDFLKNSCNATEKLKIDFHYAFYLLYNNKDNNNTIITINKIIENFKQLSSKNKQPNDMQLCYDLLSYLLDFRETNVNNTTNFLDYIKRTKNILTLMQGLTKNKKDDDENVDFFSMLSSKGLSFFAIHVMHFTRQFIHKKLIMLLEEADQIFDEYDIESPIFINWDRLLTIYHDMNVIFEEVRVFFQKIKVKKENGFHSSHYWYYDLSQNLFNKDFNVKTYIESYKMAQLFKSDIAEKNLLTPDISKDSSPTTANSKKEAKAKAKSKSKPLPLQNPQNFLGLPDPNRTAQNPKGKIESKIPAIIKLIEGKQYFDAVIKCRQLRNTENPMEKAEISFHLARCLLTIEKEKRLPPKNIAKDFKNSAIEIEGAIKFLTSLKNEYQSHQSEYDILNKYLLDIKKPETTNNTETTIATSKPVESKPKEIEAIPQKIEATPPKIEVQTIQPNLQFFSPELIAHVKIHKLDAPPLAFQDPKVNDVIEFLKKQLGITLPFGSSVTDEYPRDIDCMVNASQQEIFDIFNVYNQKTLNDLRKLNITNLKKLTKPDIISFESHGHYFNILSFNHPNKTPSLINLTEYKVIVAKLGSEKLTTTRNIFYLHPNILLDPNHKNDNSNKASMPPQKINGKTDHDNKIIRMIEGKDNKEYIEANMARLFYMLIRMRALDQIHTPTSLHQWEFSDSIKKIIAESTSSIFEPLLFGHKQTYFKLFLEFPAITFTTLKEHGKLNSIVVDYNLLTEQNINLFSKITQLLCVQINKINASKHLPDFKQQELTIIMYVYAFLLWPSLKERLSTISKKEQPAISQCMDDILNEHVKLGLLRLSFTTPIKTIWLGRLQKKLSDECPYFNDIIEKAEKTVARLNQPNAQFFNANNNTNNNATTKHFDCSKK